MNTASEQVAVEFTVPEETLRQRIGCGRGVLRDLRKKAAFVEGSAWARVNQEVLWSSAGAEAAALALVPEKIAEKTGAAVAEPTVGQTPLVARATVTKARVLNRHVVEVAVEVPGEKGPRTGQTCRVRDNALYWPGLVLSVRHESGTIWTDTQPPRGRRPLFVR